MLTGGATCPHLIILNTEHAQYCHVSAGRLSLTRPASLPTCPPADGGYSQEILTVKTSGTTLSSNALCSSLPNPLIYTRIATSHARMNVLCQSGQISQSAQKYATVSSEFNLDSELSPPWGHFAHTLKQILPRPETVVILSRVNLTSTIIYIIEDPWGLCEEADASQSSADPSTLLQFTDSGSSMQSVWSWPPELLGWLHEGG